MGKPLLTVIRDLALDPAEQAAFQAAPQDYLGRHGYDGVTADELREAVSLAADTMEPQVAQAITPPEGDEANIVETLQRVTHGTGAAFTDTAITDTAPDMAGAFSTDSQVGTTGPPGLEETATGAADAADADTGPDLAFGAGSAGELDFDSGFGEGDPGGEGDMVDTLSFGPAPLSPDADEDLDFGGDAPALDMPEELGLAEEFGLADDQADFEDGSFQEADDFAGEGQDAGSDLLGDSPLDDIGAF